MRGFWCEIPRRRRESFEIPNESLRSNGICESNNGSHQCNLYWSFFFLLEQGDPRARRRGFSLLRGSGCGCIWYSNQQLTRRQISWVVSLVARSLMVITFHDEFGSLCKITTVSMTHPFTSFLFVQFFCFFKVETQIY